jgi:hypothetical protein
MPKFRVWVEQVNQTNFEVTAKDENEAREKAYRKWRRDYGHSHVNCIEPVTKPEKG